MDSEKWKYINNYEEKYKVSNTGKVKGIDRKDSMGRPVKGVVLKPNMSNSGYEQVGLSLNGIKTKFYVHRLVAKAFISNPNNKPCINHLDGDKRNNKVNNLEWTTQSENHKHAFKNGLRKITKSQKNAISKANRGFNNKHSKLTNKQVLEIRKLYKSEDLTTKEIADLYNITFSNVAQIVRRETWKHL